MLPSMSIPPFLMIQYECWVPSMEKETCVHHCKPMHAFLQGIYITSDKHQKISSGEKSFVKVFTFI